MNRRAGRKHLARHFPRNDNSASARERRAAEPRKHLHGSCVWMSVYRSRHGLPAVIRLRAKKQLILKIAIHIPRGLKEQTRLGVAQLLEQAGSVDSIKSLLQGKVLLIHKAGYELFHDIFLHVLEFCMLCVAKADTSNMMYSILSITDVVIPKA